MRDFTEDYEPTSRIDRQKFRNWVEQQTAGRYERVHGVVVAMAPKRPIHNQRKSLAWLALRRSVQAASLPCQMFADGITIEIGDTDYDPTPPSGIVIVVADISDP